MIGLLFYAKGVNITDKVYSRITWQNQPSTATALGAQNLNKMDLALNSIDDRTIALDATKFPTSDALTMLANWDLNLTTGVVTVTLKNGTIRTYDTALEKVPMSGYIDQATNMLVFTNTDGTTTQVDIAKLVTQYEFVDTSTVGFTIGGDGKISCFVKDGSITGAKLETNYLANVTVQASTATAQAALSKRYAVGGVEAEDATDNAKYYKEQAEIAKNQAQAIVGITIGTNTVAGLAKGGGNVSFGGDGTLTAGGEKYQTAGGSSNAITLTIIGTLSAGYSTSFIAAYGNGGMATTVNTKNLYKEGTVLPPTLVSGKSYTIWCDGTSFFVRASAVGTAVASDVLAPKTFSNGTDTDVVGTRPDIGPSSAETVNLTTEGAEYTIAYGGHSGLRKIKAAITNLIASVIKAGEVVGGVTGTYAGKQSKTGSVVSSTAVSTFTYVSGATVSSLYSVTITGVPFIPRVVILKYNGGTENETVYECISGGFYPKTVRCAPYTNGNSAYNSYLIKGDVSPATVGSTVTLPVMTANVTYAYEMYE